VYEVVIDVIPANGESYVKVNNLDTGESSEIEVGGLSGNPPIRTIGFSHSQAASGNGVDLHFDDITITESPSQPLPVELADFKAQRTGTGAVLNWTTASETNNSGFAVQHATGEGSFEKAGWVDGAGTTTERKSYSFSVEDLSAGTHRFRLKQMDLDGSTSFSEEVTLQVQPDGAVAVEQVSPHPIRSSSTVRLTAKESGPVTVTLYDVLGREVRTLHEGRVAANQAEQFTVDGTSLASGTYFLRVRGEGFTRTKRITVAR
jgi:hypothetical protein